MNINLMRNKIQLHLILVFSICITSLSAQTKLLNVQTVLNNNTLISNRKLSYLIERKDTIYEGPYVHTLQPNFQTIGISRSFKTESIKFNYKQNFADGYFQLQSLLVKPDYTRFSIEKEKLGFNYSGDNKILSGNMLNGSRIGKWVYSENQVSNEAEKQIFQIEAFYKNKSLDSNFTISSTQGKTVIKGNFSSNGLLDGKWLLLEDEKEIFTLTFERGLLKAVNNTSTDFSELNSSIDSMKRVRLDSASIFLLELQLRSKYSGSEMIYVNRLLKLVEDGINNLNGEFSEIIDFEKVINLKSEAYILLPEFKRTDVFLTKYTNSKKQISAAKEINDSLLNNSTVKINKLANKNLAKNYNKSQLLAKQGSELLSIINLLADSNANYIDRKYFLSNQVDYLNQLFQVQELDKTMDTIKILAYNYNHNLAASETILSLASQYESNVVRITTEIEKEIKKLNQDKESALRDHQIDLMVDAIAAQIDTISLFFYSEAITSTYLKAYRSILTKSVSQYAALNEEDKAITAEKFISNLKRTKSRLELSQRLRENELIIADSYKEDFFNPHSYTTMQVKKHEKLYDAYFEKIMPYLIDLMINAPDLETFLDYEKNIRIVQEFMISELSKNPRALERSFKNNDKAPIIVQKLKIDIKK